MQLYPGPSTLRTEVAGRALRPALDWGDDYEQGDEYKEFEQLFAEWLEPYVSEYVGRQQRVRAKVTRRGKYKKTKDASGNDISGCASRATSCRYSEVRGLLRSPRPSRPLGTCRFATRR